MASRISSDFPLRYEFGAEGIASLQEDNVPDRDHCTQHPGWTFAGPFGRSGDNSICLNCELQRVGEWLSPPFFEPRPREARDDSHPT